MPILPKYKRWNDGLELYEDEYFDMYLTQDDTPSIGDEPSTRCLVSFIDCNDGRCLLDDGLISNGDYIWSGVSEGVVLKDIGLTGVDNGIVNYDKDNVTNEQFYNILTTKEPDGNPLTIPAHDYSLKLYKVTGNTKTYTYPSELITSSGGTSGSTFINYYALKGGFFQGFWKLQGFDYQVLPQYIDDAWDIEMVIRPMDYETDDNILNASHNNSGIIFYMGTRAENKFSLFYNGEKKVDDICEEHNQYDDTDGYFIENKSEDYLIDEICLSGKSVETSEGDAVDETGGYKIETDNKYLFFNRTCDGFTTDTWDNCDTLLLEGKNKKYKGTVKLDDCEETEITTDNLYLLMNRTKTGHTTDNIDELETGNESGSYDTYADLYNNAFAIRIDENGHIGYRYAVKDCDADDKVGILEEYCNGKNAFTFENGKWYTIHIRFQILDGDLDDCGNPTGERKMKIYIYVNGYLKFISKELPEFNFKALNDTPEKQESVPFNISLGGGTIGLGDSVWLDKNEVFAPGLKLENYFAGTFIGDIMSFKFYECSQSLEEIRNNYKANKQLIENV